MLHHVGLIDELNGLNELIFKKLLEQPLAHSMCYVNSSQIHKLQRSLWNSSELIRWKVGFHLTLLSILSDYIKRYIYLGFTLYLEYFSNIWFFPKRKEASDSTSSGQGPLWNVNFVFSVINFTLTFFLECNIDFSCVMWYKIYLRQKVSTFQEKYKLTVLVTQIPKEGVRSSVLGSAWRSVFLCLWPT